MYIAEQHIQITLDDFLNFIHKKLEDNFSNSVQTIDIIIHIKNESRKEEMRQLLALEDIGVIRIKKLKLERDNNKDFQEYLEKYRCYEGNDIFTYLTKSSPLNKIRSKLGFPEKIGIKELQKIKENSDKNPYIKTDYFSSDRIYKDWEEFKNKIPPYSVFTAKIQVVPLFFYDIFHTLVYREADISVSKVVTELYENISSEIGEKRNSNKEVTIFYPLENYINTQSSIYPVLYELEQIGILRISKQEIKNWKIYFTLTDINNFTLEECKKAFRKIQKEKSDKIVFKNESVYINNELVSFRGKKSKIFQVVKAYFELSQELQKQEISFVDLESSGKIKHKMDIYDYDSFNNALKDANERISRQHSIDEFIRVTKSSLICKYLQI